MVHADIRRNLWRARAFQGRTAAVGRKRRALSASILVVEDNSINQSLARQLREREGCSVQVAENGRVAMDAILGRRFELVLMDIQMPEMDGVTATEMVRRREEPNPGTAPRVALTGGVRADRDVCLDTGMDDFVAKPLCSDGARLPSRPWRDD